MLAPFARAPRARFLTRLAGAGKHLVASARHRWFLDQHAQFWFTEFGSAWSPSTLRARVVELVDETPEARSFVLATNRHWPGHRAGQYVPIEIEQGGVRVRRCYSISSGGSPPGATRLTLTIQRIAGGRVSSWAHDHLLPGALLGLGRPAGEFVLAPRTTTSRPLLLIAGGSGITPIRALLRQLEADHALAGTVVIHSARDEAHAIFGRELAVMAGQHPELHLVPHRSGAAGRLDAARLTALVPDLGTREVYVCGPGGLIDVALEAATRAGAAAHVHHERFFAATPPPPTPDAAVAPQAQRVQVGPRTVAVDGAGTLLEQLERAGERPASGCRMGICNTCRCTKRRGAVLDLTTGRISSAPDEEIRPCISIPRSDLELADVPTLEPAP